MCVIVAGAASFIERAVTKELLVGGYHVLAMIRPGSPGLPQLEMLTPEAEGKPGRRGECLTFLPLVLKDIRKLGSYPILIPSPTLKSHFTSKRVAELWLHLGWEGAGNVNRQDPYVQARSIGYALDSLHTATHLGYARFLFCGSQAEYDIVGGIMGEEILCHPVSGYGKDKLEVCRRAGEDAGALGIDYIHARISSVYGPGDHLWSLVSACLDTFFKGGRMEFGACTQQWNFLHARDAVRTLMGLLFAKIPAGMHSVVGEDARPLKPFVGQTHRLCGEKGACEYGKRLPNAGGVVSLAPDIRKLKEVAGSAQEISSEDGIKETIGIYKENCP